MTSDLLDSFRVFCNANGSAFERLTTITRYVAWTQHYGENPRWQPQAEMLSLVKTHLLRISHIWLLCYIVFVESFGLLIESAYSGAKLVRATKICSCRQVGNTDDAVSRSLLVTCAER